MARKKKPLSGRKGMHPKLNTSEISTGNTASCSQKSCDHVNSQFSEIKNELKSLRSMVEFAVRLLTKLVPVSIDDFQNILSGSTGFTITTVPSVMTNEADRLEIQAVDDPMETEEDNAEMQGVESHDESPSVIVQIDSCPPSPKEKKLSRTSSRASSCIVETENTAILPSPHVSGVENAVKLNSDSKVTSHFVSSETDDDHPILERENLEFSIHNVWPSNESDLSRSENGGTAHISHISDRPTELHTSDVDPLIETDQIEANSVSHFHVLARELQKQLKSSVDIKTGLKDNTQYSGENESHNSRTMIDKESEKEQINRGNDQFNSDKSMKTSDVPPIDLDNGSNGIFTLPHTEISSSNEETKVSDVVVKKELPSEYDDAEQKLQHPNKVKVEPEGEYVSGMIPECVLIKNENEENTGNNRDCVTDGTYNENSRQIFSEYTTPASNEFNIYELGREVHSQQISQNQIAAKYRQYDSNSLFRAVKLVREEKYSVYKASKECKVPWSTLKGFLRRIKNDDDARQCLPKLGKPFALPVDMEQKIYKYIIEMQELRFGLTVKHIRKLAFKLATLMGINHPFSEKEQAAGKSWWNDFRNRYGLTLRVPENITTYRSSMSNRGIVDDFYNRLKTLLVNLKIEGHPELIWNCDETGISYVVKPSEIDTAIGRKYVYNGMYAERGENHTMVACANACGHWIPPMIIFKGMQMSDDLLKDTIAGSLVKISPNGLINGELFVEWFNHFLTSIPPSRPVILLMNSHSSHISEEVIDLARKNKIFLLTFPSRTCYMLQPLAVGVYHPFREEWAKSLNVHMAENPGHKLERSDFHRLMKPAFYSAFSPQNIISSFKKTGICPFNPAVIYEAISTSKLEERPEETNAEVECTTETVEEIISVPDIELYQDRRTKKRDGRIKCLIPLQEPATKRLKGMPDKEKKTDCVACGKYSDDVRKKNGVEWIQCSFCLMWYHTACQDAAVDEDVFMCDRCQSDSDED